MNINDLLIKPNISPLQPHAERTRRNLIVISAIGIFMGLNSVNIKTESAKFAGLVFTDLKISHVYILITCCLLYLLIYFFWLIKDQHRECRYRLTGLKVAEPRKGLRFNDGNLEPGTAEERQSTLFSWASIVSETHKRYSDQLDPNFLKRSHSGAELEIRLKEVFQRLDATSDMLEYINESLSRFEGGFWAHQRSQLIRWLVFDTGIPIALGLFSTFLMAIELKNIYCT